MTLTFLIESKNLNWFFLNFNKIKLLNRIFMKDPENFKSLTCSNHKLNQAFSSLKIHFSTKENPPNFKL